MRNALFIGDSITEGFDLDVYFPGDNFINHGISGFTSSQVLDSIDESWFRNHPRQIFICIGTNDLAHSIESSEITGNISKLVDFIKETTTTDAIIYITSLFPTRHNPTRPNPVIDKLNESLHQLSLDLQVRYLHLNSFFRDHNGQLCRHFTMDGLHLNADAYKQWQKLLMLLMKE
jgi:lysophospholipase L1-like esterase